MKNTGYEMTRMALKIGQPKKGGGVAYSFFFEIFSPNSRISLCRLFRCIPREFAASV